MQALVQDTYGAAADVMKLSQIDKPRLDETTVLVRVHAAGVNPADWAVMSGLPYIARPIYGFRRPKVAVRGTDVAGTVAAVGSGVTRFKPGDEVYGASTGSYAEYAAASQDELAPKPTRLTFDQAATVPMAGLVALQALRDHGKVGVGHKVLINGASGGIGTFAVQIAKALGAEVTAVVSTRNVELVRSIGADHVIDYTKSDFTRAGQRYDFILDNVSNHSLRALRRVLSPTGTLIPNGGNFGNRWFSSAARLMRGMVLFRFGRQSLGNFLVSTNHADLVALTALVDAGKVVPVMDRTYLLAEGAKALGHVGSGHARGKTVISVLPEASHGRRHRPHRDGRERGGRRSAVRGPARTSAEQYRQGVTAGVTHRRRPGNASHRVDPRGESGADSGI